MVFVLRLVGYYFLVGNVCQYYVAVVIGTLLITSTGLSMHNREPGMIILNT